MKRAVLVVIGLATFLGIGLAQKPVEYTGDIVKNNGTFVLVEAATKVVYHLDNQKKSRDFAGAKVVVAGTLDGNTMTIHVKCIRTAPGVQNVVQWGERFR